MALFLEGLASSAQGTGAGRVPINLPVAAARFDRLADKKSQKRAESLGAALGEEIENFANLKKISVDFRRLPQASYWWDVLPNNHYLNSYRSKQASNSKRKEPLP
jgi:hypothetical protein